MNRPYASSNGDFLRIVQDYGLRTSNMASCCSQHSHPIHNESSGSLVEKLYAENARFLAFIEKRVGSRELAEEILQDAYVRGLTHANALREDESITAWFYRVLRNSIIDRYRRRGAEARSLERVAAEADEASPSMDDELMDNVCSCVGALVETLKPEYQAAIKRVDLEGASVSVFAEEAEVTANNARVRIHRAREALRKKVTDFCGSCASGGCRDCGCGKGDSP